MSFSYMDTFPRENIVYLFKGRPCNEAEKWVTVFQMELFKKDFVSGSFFFFFFFFKINRL